MLTWTDEAALHVSTHTTLVIALSADGLGTIPEINLRITFAIRPVRGINSLTLDPLLLKLTNLVQRRKVWENSEALVKTKLEVDSL